MGIFVCSCIFIHVTISGCSLLENRYANGSSGWSARTDIQMTKLPFHWFMLGYHNPSVYFICFKKLSVQTVFYNTSKCYFWKTFFSEWGPSHYNHLCDGEIFCFQPLVSLIGLEYWGDLSKGLLAVL